MMTVDAVMYEDFLFEHFNLTQQQLISYKIFWVDSWLSYRWIDASETVGGLDLPSVGRVYKTPPPTQLLLLSNGQKIVLFDRNSDYLMRCIVREQKKDICVSSLNREWLVENSNDQSLEHILSQWDHSLKTEIFNDVSGEEVEGTISTITSALPVTVRNMDFVKQNDENNPAWSWEISNGFINLTCSYDEFNKVLKPYLESGQSEYLGSGSAS